MKTRCNLGGNLAFSRKKIPCATQVKVPSRKSHSDGSAKYVPALCFQQNHAQSKLVVAAVEISGSVLDKNCLF